MAPSVSAEAALETIWVSWGESGEVRESLGVRRPGMVFWRVFKEERVWVSAGNKYSRIVDTCRGEHLLQTVQV